MFPYRAAAFEEAELLRRLRFEQETSAHLAAEVRELRLVSRKGHSEKDYRELLQARLGRQRLQLEVEKMAAQIVGLKSKISGEFGTFDWGYLAAIERGYEQ